MIEFDKYCIKGFCEFSLDDSLSQVTQKTIPDGYGVYRFRANAKDGKILYIGKGGTVNTDGTYKKQQLRERLNNKQDRIRREQFLKNKLIESNGEIERVFIEWFIIQEPDIMPAYMEASLMQEYYAEYHKLPEWNEAF